MWEPEIMVLPPHNDHMYKREHPHALGTDAAVGVMFGFPHTFKTLAPSENPGTGVVTVFPTLPAWASSRVKVFPPVVKGSFDMLSDALHGARPGPGSHSSQ